MSVPHVYSFTATFEDGSVVELNHKEENSDFSQSKEGGSRFTDVLEKEKESKLISFVLHNDQISAGVDLRDGHFELNGVPFFVHRPDREFYKDFRIIYYRSMQQTYNQSSGETTGQCLGYVIGWQCNDKDGSNIQRTVIIW